MDNHKPIIRRLTVERFRGIERLEWAPDPGINVILGGGDVGKTTILDAIALVLSPSNTTVLSDADYWHREVEKGFCIEAVMSLPDTCGINQQAKNAWPWQWDGKEPRLPEIDGIQGSSDSASEPVYRLRVRGTEEFDLAFEILQPDDTADHFSASVRRKIGVVRLSGDDRNDRDLRLVQGSALERLLSDKTLRSRVAQNLAKEGDVTEELKEEAKIKLSALDITFREQKLPDGLSLGLTGGQGLSLNALIGLTAAKDGVNLPLASWGAGTRRLAALEIAAANHLENPITLVDEVERGLEPYRQRVLMTKLQRGGSQVFLTTHSAAALRSASGACFWYLDGQGTVGRLPDSVSAHLNKDPEAFLARLTVVAEGKTEVGFVGYLLEQAIGDYLSLGIWITDGDGNQNTLQLLEGLTKGGLNFSGFVDNEGTSPKRWAALQEKLGRLLFQWPIGNLEQNIIRLVPDHLLEEFIKDANGDAGERLRTLASRLGIKEKEFSVIRSNATDLRQLIIEAATGVVPDDKKNGGVGEIKTLKKHAERWFKSREGGRELAMKVFKFGLWPQLVKSLLPFLTAVRETVLPFEITTPPS